MEKIKKVCNLKITPIIIITIFFFAHTATYSYANSRDLLRVPLSFQGTVNRNRIGSFIAHPGVNFDIEWLIRRVERRSNVKISIKLKEEIIRELQEKPLSELFADDSSLFGSTSNEEVILKNRVLREVALFYNALPWLSNKGQYRVVKVDIDY